MRSKLRINLGLNVQDKTGWIILLKGCRQRNLRELAVIFNESVDFGILPHDVSVRLMIHKIIPKRIENCDVANLFLSSIVWVPVPIPIVREVDRWPHIGLIAV